MTVNNYRILAQNRKANFNYEIQDEFEAGMVLLGSEIKSLRNGKANIQDAFIEIDKNTEPYLVNAHISPYTLSNRYNHSPLRKRKLLLNKKEINKILGKVKTKGVTVIPLTIYLNAKNIAKVKIAIAKGKKIYDKREDIKEKEWKRERARLLKNEL